MNRAELKNKAKQSLKGKYGSAIGILLIFMLISTVASACAAIPVVGFIIPTLVTCIIGFGYLNFFLKTSRGQEASVNELWSCAGMWWLYFIITICSSFFIFAWSLLFVIPGIIASYRYRMAYHIALDNPNISGLDAIRKSKEMMKGHKAELFVLDLSFFGWFILCGFTFGILLFYVIPYYGVTVANFYNNLIGRNDSTNGNSNMNYTQPVVPGSQPEAVSMPIDNNVVTQNTNINMQTAQSMNTAVNMQTQNAFINEQPIQPVQTMDTTQQPFEVPPVVNNVADNSNIDNTVI